MKQRDRDKREGNNSPIVVATYLEQLLIPDLPFPSHGFLPFRFLLLLNKPTMRASLASCYPRCDKNAAFEQQTLIEREARR